MSCGKQVSRESSTRELPPPMLSPLWLGTDSEAVVRMQEDHGRRSRKKVNKEMRRRTRHQIKKKKQMLYILFCSPLDGSRRLP